MKLIYAITSESHFDAISHMEETAEYIDIFDFIPNFFRNVGFSSIKEFKTKFPNHTILMNMKKYIPLSKEVSAFFENGGDDLIVSGELCQETIKKHCDTTHSFSGKFYVEIEEFEDKYKRAMELSNLNIDYFGIHGSELMKSKNVSLLDEVRDFTLKSDLPIFVAGGVTLHNLQEFIKFRPEMIAIGRGITDSKNPRETAKKIKETIIKSL